MSVIFNNIGTTVSFVNAGFHTFLQLFRIELLVKFPSQGVKIPYYLYGGKYWKNYPQSFFFSSLYLFI